MSGSAKKNRVTERTGYSNSRYCNTKVAHIGIVVGTIFLFFHNLTIRSVRSQEEGGSYTLIEVELKRSRMCIHTKLVTYV